MALKDYLLYFVILILLCAIMAYGMYSIQKKSKSQLIKLWPKTTATVKFSSVGERITEQKYNNYNLRHFNSVKYYPFVEYVYTVNGVDYESSNLYYNGTDPDTDSSKSWVRFKIDSKYKIGQQFDVYYNPINPSESYKTTKEDSWFEVLLDICTPMLMVTSFK